MSSQSSSLYGIARPKHETKNEISSTTASSFSANLSSLLAQSRPSTTTSARARPAKSNKHDIFSVHNKGAKKRAAADISTADGEQKHKTDIGAIDTHTLHRSKRKMEEKARLYAAMKRGDYVAPKGYVNDEREPLVDFDRKWAESEETGKEAKDSSSDSGLDSEEELVEYADEYGRTRKGTKAEAVREQRRQRIKANAEEELHEMSARPKMPEKLIYGDTVQSAAFNPDELSTTQMEELARRRDRSVTPPDATHYDATKEVRSKGQGFYQFSQGKEDREREMGNLDATRKETEKWEEERKARRDKKEKDMEERRKKIKDMRGQREAEGFLKGLAGELQGFVNAKDANGS